MSDAGIARAGVPRRCSCMRHSRWVYSGCSPPQGSAAQPLKMQCRQNSAGISAVSTVYSGATHALLRRALVALVEAVDVLADLGTARARQVPLSAVFRKRFSGTAAVLLELVRRKSHRRRSGLVPVFRLIRVARGTRRPLLRVINGVWRGWNITGAHGPQRTGFHARGACRCARQPRYAARDKLRARCESQGSIPRLCRASASSARR